MNKVKMVEIKLPCDVEFASGIMALAGSLAKRLKLSADAAAKMERGVDEACSIIRKHATDANESCNVLMVGDQEKLQIGIVNYGNALNIKTDDPSFKALENTMDEVKHQVLPTRGFLLTMTKRFA
jgi:anti-sigma regulatory factor (Ser/Thr protein kinase)